jgi:hypothetical protein
MRGRLRGKTLSKKKAFANTRAFSKFGGSGVRLTVVLNNPR